MVQIAGHVVCTSSVTTVAGIGRPQIEAYRTWLAGRGGYRKNSTISNTTFGMRMRHLAAFFRRIIEWATPTHPLGRRSSRPTDL